MKKYIILILILSLLFLPLPAQAAIKTNFPTEKITSYQRIWNLGVANNYIVWTSRLSGSKRNILSIYNLRNRTIQNVKKDINPYKPVICGKKILYWQNHSDTTQLISYSISSQKKQTILEVGLNRVDMRCAGNYLAFSENTRLYLYNLRTKKRVLISSDVSWINRSWSLFTLTTKYLIYSEGDIKGKKSNLVVYYRKTGHRIIISEEAEFIYEFAFYNNKLVYHAKNNDSHQIFIYNLTGRRKKSSYRSRDYLCLQDFSGNKIVWIIYDKNVTAYQGKIYLYNYRTKRKKSLTKNSIKMQLKYSVRLYRRYLIWNAVDAKKSSLFLSRM